MREVLRSEARSTSLIAVVRVEIRKYEHHHHHHQYYHHNTAKQNGEFANSITSTISIISKTWQNKMVTKGADMSALFRFSQTFGKEVGHSQIIQLLTQFVTARVDWHEHLCDQICTKFPIQRLKTTYLSNSQKLSRAKPPLDALVLLLVKLLLLLLLLPPTPAPLPPPPPAPPPPSWPKNCHHGFV